MPGKEAAIRIAQRLDDLAVEMRELVKRLVEQIAQADVERRRFLSAGMTETSLQRRAAVGAHGRRLVATAHANARFVTGLPKPRG